MYLDVEAMENLAFLIERGTGQKLLIPLAIQLWGTAFHRRYGNRYYTGADRGSIHQGATSAQWVRKFSLQGVSYCSLVNCNPDCISQNLLRSSSSYYPQESPLTLYPLL
jgi:hypothetical protein